MRNVIQIDVGAHAPETVAHRPQVDPRTGVDFRVLPQSVDNDIQPEHERTQQEEDMASGPVAYADSDDEEIAERRKAGGRYSEWLQTNSVYEQGFNIPSGLLRSVDGSALSDDDEQVNDFE